MAEVYADAPHRTSFAPLSLKKVRSSLLRTRRNVNETEASFPRQQNEITCDGEEIKNLGDLGCKLHENGYYLASKKLCSKLAEPKTREIHMVQGCNLSLESEAKVQPLSSKGIGSGSRRFCLLKNGLIKFYPIGANKSGLLDDDELFSEETVHIQQIRNIRMEDLKSKSFQLILWKKPKQSITTKFSFPQATFNRKSSLKRKSIRDIRTSMSLSRYKKHNIEMEEQEEGLVFNFASSNEVHRWVKHLLIECENMAKLLESYSNILTKVESKYSASDLMRSSVDMWTLARGHDSPKAQKARRQLASLLEEAGEIQESNFWFKTVEENIEPRHCKQELFFQLTEFIRKYDSECQDPEELARTLFHRNSAENIAKRMHSKFKRVPEEWEHFLTKKAGMEISLLRDELDVYVKQLSGDITGSEIEKLI